MFRKKKTLMPIIQKYIKPGSIIHSDCWQSYHCLKDLGYIHKTVNHSKQFINYKNGACTNKIKEEWRHARHCMPHYGVQKGLRYGYLAQFLWKRKYHNDVLFTTIIDHMNECFEIGDLSCAPKLKC